MTLLSSSCCFEVCRQSNEEKELKAFRTRLKESERHLNINKKAYQIPLQNKKYEFFQDSDEVLDFWKRKKRLNVYYHPSSSSYSQAHNSFQALGQGYDIKNYDETDDVGISKRRGESRQKRQNNILDATTPSSSKNNNNNNNNQYRSRSVPTTSSLTSTSTVVLKRRYGQQLGLGIAGGADRAIPPTISFLRPGFIAHRCDQLQPGERLVAVNNISVASLTHEQILTVLRSAGDLVKLEVEYNLNDPVFNKPKNAMHRCAEIILEKETGGFGFTIRGGSYGPDHRKSRAVTITAIRPGGPAHREGRMRVGDRIVTINGTDVSSATLASVQQIVAEIDLVARFVIEYDVSLFDTVKNATGPLSIEVEKIPGAEFGVSLAICEKTDPISNLQKRGVFVDHVTLASVADRCGAIHPGDEILMIDGIGLEFTTLEEAMQLLKGYCTTVKLEIIPHSQMSRDEAGRKSRRRHHHQVNGKVIHSKGKENSKRSESCDYQPSYGMKGFEPRARSHEKPISNERRKTQKVQRFTSNAVEQQKMQGLSGSVPAVHQSATPVMARSTEFSRSVYVDSGIPPSSRSTGSVSGSLFSAVPSGQVCHMETLDVFLQAQTTSKSGFGLLLNRNDNRSSDSDSGRFAPLFIASIEKNSSADKCGVLQVGDRVLAINDWHTANSTIEEANHILRHANQSLTLTVEFDVIESVLPSTGIFTVKLAKRGSNLGIVCRSETNGEKGEPVIISEIRTGSVAHRCGSIQRGDQIISIDNIPLESCTVEEAMRLLQRSGDVIKLAIKKCSNGNQDLDSSQVVVYSIELTRKGQPLGITIASSGERGDPIIISQLASNGLAERTGALHVGDRILAINNESLDGKMVSEAMHILQQSTEMVTLKISRVIDQSPQHYVPPYSPLSPMFSKASRALAGSGTHPLSTIRSDSASETSGKLSTPIQSIDSAVESLEDSPNSKNNQMSSSVHVRINDESHKRFDGNANRRSDLILSGRQNSSTSARSFSKPPSSSNEAGSSVERTGWDSGLSSTADTSHTANECCGCSNNNIEDNDSEDWKRILEALETVGEEEMLKKLEESIMSGHVPNQKQYCQCSILSNADDPASVSILNRKMQQTSTTSINVPGSNLNTSSTILRHPPFISSSTTSAKDYLHVNDTYGFRSQSPCSDGTLELPPSMPPPKSHISVGSGLDDKVTSPRRLSTLLMMLSEQTANLPMIDATSPIHNDLDNYVTDVKTFTVHLRKDPHSRTFGFSVSDGVNINQGVYINTISPGSPADRCGNIRPFDRILKINSTDIQDLHCNLAVPLLAADEVDLLLERTTIIPQSPRSRPCNQQQRGPTVQSAV